MSTKNFHLIKKGFCFLMLWLTMPDVSSGNPLIILPEFSSANGKVEGFIRSKNVRLIDGEWIICSPMTLCTTRVNGTPLGRYDLPDGGLVLARWSSIRHKGERLTLVTTILNQGEDRTIIIDSSGQQRGFLLDAEGNINHYLDKLTGIGGGRFLNTIRKADDKHRTRGWVHEIVELSDLPGGNLKLISTGSRFAEFKTYPEREEQFREFFVQPYSNRGFPGILVTHELGRVSRFWAPRRPGERLFKRNHFELGSIPRNFFRDNHYYKNARQSSRSFYNSLTRLTAVDQHADGWIVAYQEPNRYSESGDFTLHVLFFESLHGKPIDLAPGGIRNGYYGGIFVGKLYFLHHVNRETAQIGSINLALR